MAESPGCVAQVAFSCQFCEKSIEVKVKCYDCSLLLCKACNFKLHSKLSFKKKHKIVDIGNLSDSEVTREVNLDIYHKITCKTHSLLQCCLFCVSCDSLVCSSCLLDGHKDHTLEEIQVAFEKKKGELHNFRAKLVEDLIPGAQLEKKAIDNLLLRMQTQQDKTQENIENQLEAITQLMKSYSLKILKQQKSFAKRSTVLTERSKLDQQEQEFMDKRDAITEVLDSPNIDDVLSMASTIKEPAQLYKPILTPLFSMLEFVQGNCSDEDKQKMFGSLLEIRLQSSYTTDLPDVGIIVSHEDFLWIANKERKIVRQIKAGSELDIITNIDNTELSDMSFTNSGEIIWKISKSNKLKIFAKNTNQKLFHDFTPLKPTCVHVLSSGDIAIGVKENGSNFVLSQNSRRQLQIWTTNRKQRCVYEYDSDKTRLFTYIWNVSSSRSDDICVIDRSSDDFRGRLVMLENGGKLKWIFDGETSNPFKPRDLVVTAAGNIVVSERITHSLYILSSSGRLLVRLITTGIEISLPQALCIDKSGNLWIGCGTSKGEKKHAKLHCTRLSFLA